MSCPNDLLLFLREVSTEEFRSIRKHPGTPIGDLDASEDVRGILVELILNRLASVRGNRCDVDEASYAIIHPRRRNGSAAVGMAHEDGGTAHAAERALHGGHVLLERV